MLTQLTGTLTTLITNLYATTGIAGIVLAMAIESFCIPLPSEIVMPLAGIMIVQGKLLPGVSLPAALIIVALAGAAGNLIGSIAAYGVGDAGGRPLLLKYGRYLLISQHDSDTADRFFQKYGSATAFFSRLLPVVRTYISLPAGISKMPFWKFCVFTVLGAFPWSLLLAYVGTIIGNNIDKLSPIFHSLDVVILVVLVILLALYIWRHVRNDRKARAALVAEHATPSASQPTPQGWNQQQSPFQQPASQTPPQGWGQQQTPPPPQQHWGQPPQQFQPSQPQQGQNWQQPWYPQQGSDNTARRG